MNEWTIQLFIPLDLEISELSHWKPGWYFFILLALNFFGEKLCYQGGKKTRRRRRGRRGKKKKMKPKILIHEFYKWLTVQSAYLDINSWYSLRCWRIECFILVLFIWCHLFLTSAWSHRDHPQQIGREKYVMLLLI